MQEHFKTLEHTPLFAGFSRGELGLLLEGRGPSAPALLAPRLHAAARGETLLMAGYATRRIGVVLQGRLEAYKESAQGSEGARLLVARLGPGRIFGDVLAGGGGKSPVTVTACLQSLVLYINWGCLLRGGTRQETELLRRLLANLAAEISEKYFALDRRLDLLLLHGLRRRVAAYLLQEAAAAGSFRFSIPLNRAALAAWLGCDRSALSRELSAMAKAGLLQTRRFHFYLPNPQALQALLTG